VTMTYHPRTGAVPLIAGVKGKSSGVALVDLFDMVFAMAYTQYDTERRHSSPDLDKAALSEWVSNGLPASKLVLGMPFFGVDQRTGEAKTYGEIVDNLPRAATRRGVNNPGKEIYFVNARSLTEKVVFALKQQIGGVMIWELGQDKPVHSGISLLEPVWEAALTGQVLPYSLSERLPGFGENEFIGMLASVVGAALLYGVLFKSHPREAFQPPPVPRHRDDNQSETTATTTASTAAATATTATATAAAASEKEQEDQEEEVQAEEEAEGDADDSGGTDSKKTK